jgi:type II secretory pathway component PulF
MIVFLGVVIGFILVAMYMPIFKMGGAVAGA